MTAAGHETHRPGASLGRAIVFFGVWAVDTDGNRSPAGFPQPTT
jgi:hypothetical protein